MLKQRLDRSCPVCKNKTGEILHQQSFILPNGNPLPPVYDIVSCEKCGFVFADTPAEQEDYDNFYRNLSKYEGNSAGSGAGICQIDKERLSRTADDVSEMASKKTVSILDIGCANGGLLVELRRRGYQNVFGIDPSPICVLKAGERGLNVVQGGLFSEWKLPQEKFDVITLSHVLEHVRDLRGAFKKIISHLEKDGLLYIEVPNAREYRNYLIAPFYFFDAEHINHFDHNSLVDLGNTHGLGLVRSIEKLIRPSSDSLYPAIGCFYRNNKDKKDAPQNRNLQARDSVVKHINDSKLNQNWQGLELLAEQQTEIIVWGAGSNTHRLLKNSPLGECKIIGFIDKDKRKQGQILKEVKIYSSKILKKLTCPIVISSALMGKEIYAEIKSMRVKNKIIETNGIKRKNG